MCDMFEYVLFLDSNVGIVCQILRESCWVFSSDIINAACSMPEFILAGSKLLTQFSILLKFVFSAIMQVDGIDYRMMSDEW